MHIIIGMPPHIIIIGIPIAIIAFIASQRSVMRAIIDGSIGIIFMTMPSFVISQDIRHVIGIIPPLIIGIIIGIIMPLPIMPPIIGIIPPPIIGFIIMGIIPPPIPPPIMGFIAMGIPPPIMGFIMGFIIPPIGMLLIGMLLIGMLFGMLFIGIPPIIEPLIVGMAFIGSPSIEPFGCDSRIEPSGMRDSTPRT